MTKDQNENVIELKKGGTLTDDQINDLLALGKNKFLLKRAEGADYDFSQISCKEPIGDIKLNEELNGTDHFWAVIVGENQKKPGVWSDFQLLKEIHMNHSKVKSIPEGTFRLCTNLEKVTFPEGLTKIGSLAFTNCHKLNVTIPNKVKRIGSSAFSNCSSLNEISLSENIKYLGSDVFSGCTELTSITINQKSNIKKIPAGFVRGCTKLTSMSIPGSVTQVGKNAFENCDNLKEVNITGESINLGVLKQIIKARKKVNIDPNATINTSYKEYKRSIDFINHIKNIKSMDNPSNPGFPGVPTKIGTVTVKPNKFNIFSKRISAQKIKDFMSLKDQNKNIKIVISGKLSDKEKKVIEENGLSGNVSFTKGDTGTIKNPEVDAPSAADTLANVLPDQKKNEDNFSPKPISEKCSGPKA